MLAQAVRAFSSTSSRMSMQEFISCSSQSIASSMITRRVSSCLRSSRIYCVRDKRINHGAVQRRLSSTSTPPPALPPPSSVSPLAAISSELDRLSPRFDVSADSIEIIRGPVEFFEVLKVGFLSIYSNNVDTFQTKISSAKRRIYLSTLYVGKSEYELVCTL
jgi:CDP-diacylglycerol---glycerol-3-phosphate 3-phosphatidyltransferase